MKRFLTISFLALIMSISSVTYAGWIGAGSYGGDDNILLDDNIKPVANGSKIIYPNVFTISYKISMQGNGYIYNNYLIDLESGKSCPLPGKTEMLTLSDRSVYVNEVDSVWAFDPTGSNHWTFSAYLWKNYKKINKNSPYTINESLQTGLADRTPKWTVDSNGWLKVYEKSNGSKAWIQTKSIQIAQENKDALLPSVQILICRKIMHGMSSEITYSLEKYDPNEMSLTFMKAWQKNESDKSLMDKDLPVKKVIPAKVPDDNSTIASAAYIYDILHGNPGITKVGFPALELQNNWFNF